MDIQYLKQLLLLVEEEESIDFLISKNPTVFTLDNIDANKVSNYYLPYSIGIEIECNRNDETFNLENFTNIPNILDVNITNDEQRFRIPSGLIGLQCLYNISLQLKRNSLLNPLSGIHYHVDCTDTYRYFREESIIKNEKWILEELDKWDYKGTYNNRRVRFNTSHNWLRFQSEFNTAEFRIGEMTFDYEVLFIRIIHCCKIVHKLKISCVKEYNKYLEENIKKENPILLYDNDDNITDILKNRIKKI